MRRLLWRVIGAVVLALAAIGSFNMALWVADRDPPVHYTSARALATFVRQGETIGVQFDVFRERVCPADIKRWLYDSAGNRHAIPTFTTGLELLAGGEVYERTITIPMSAEPGRAVYEVCLITSATRCSAS